MAAEISLPAMSLDVLLDVLPAGQCLVAQPRDNTSLHLSFMVSIEGQVLCLAASSVPLACAFLTPERGSSRWRSASQFAERSAHDRKQAAALPSSLSAHSDAKLCCD